MKKAIAMGTALAMLLTGLMVLPSATASLPGDVDVTASPAYQLRLGRYVAVTSHVEVPTSYTMSVEVVLPSFLRYIPSTFLVDGESVEPTVKHGVISTEVGEGNHTIRFYTQTIQLEATSVTGTIHTYVKYDGDIVHEASVDVTTVPYCGFHKRALLETAGDDTYIDLNENVIWTFQIKVENKHTWTMEDVVIYDRLAAELEIDGLVSITEGTTLETKTKGKSQKVTLKWTIGDLEPGETAELVLTISTDTNPSGKQEYTSPGDYELNSGATLKLINEETGFQHSAHTPSIEFAVPGYWENSGWT